MKNKKIFLILLIPILIGLASACSCIYLENTKQKYDNAQYVFSGKLTNLDLLESYPEQYRAKFRIFQEWKDSDNKINKEVTIYSLKDSGANCGYNFEKDKEYLIYAYLDEETNTISTNSCMGNLILDSAQKEIEELNEIKTPITVKLNPLSRAYNWIKSLFS